MATQRHRSRIYLSRNTLGSGVCLAGEAIYRANLVKTREGPATGRATTATKEPRRKKYVFVRARAKSIESKLVRRVSAKSGEAAGGAACSHPRKVANDNNRPGEDNNKDASKRKINKKTINKQTTSGNAQVDKQRGALGQCDSAERKVSQFELIPWRRQSI